MSRDNADNATHSSLHVTFRTETAARERERREGAERATDVSPLFVYPRFAHTHTHIHEIVHALRGCGPVCKMICHLKRFRGIKLFNGSNCLEMLTVFPVCGLRYFTRALCAR